MKIIVFLSSLYTGGAEFSTLSFYGWLLKRGYTVKLVGYKRATPSYDERQFGFDQIHYLDGDTFLQRLRVLNKIVNEFKPQLLHSVLFEANIVARANRVMNGNFIHLESLVNEMYSPHRLHDPNVTWLKLKGYQWFDRLTQRWGVDHFHATGNSVSKHYQNKLGISPDRITVIQRGREENAFISDKEFQMQLRSTLNIPEQEVILIMVARHEFQKGHDVLLKALVQMKTNQPWVCLLAGREGNFTAAIRQQIKEANLEEKVKILGHRTDVPQLLAVSDIFVFPSRFEGLPGALIEAEAAGLPVVCSDIPNNREVVEENRNAFLFPVDDVTVLSSSLIALIEDANTRRKMGQASRLIFNKKFHAEVSHTAMMNLLEKLGSRNSH